MNGGEIAFLVIFILAAAYLLYVQRNRMIWRRVYEGQERDGRDAVNLQAELEQQGIRARLSTDPTWPLATHAYVLGPTKRHVAVHHADVNKARPLMLQWAERYKAQRLAALETERQSRSDVL